MTAAIGQDFEVVAGDAIAPIFTVYRDKAMTQPLDISTMAEIFWQAEDTWMGGRVLQKKKSLGQIVFVTDGTDGKIQVTILGADTAPLMWAYAHEVILQDVANDQNTVTLGSMVVRPRAGTA